MKVQVDVAGCVGHGRCAALAPDVYELDDLGYQEHGVIDVPAGSEPDAERGALACPERILTLRDD